MYWWCHLALYFTWSDCVPMTRMGVSGAWQAMELNQKSNPACSNPILMFHSNMYTALLDMKNCKEIEKQKKSNTYSMLK